MNRIATLAFALLLAGGLSLLVGVAALRMAWKGLTARTWLPFHAAAAGTEWAGLPPRPERLLLFQVRMVGVGFLAVAVLLLALPALLAWRPDRTAALATLGTAGTHCLGIGFLNHRLHHEAGIATPWKVSFAAAGLLLVAAILALAPG